MTWKTVSRKARQKVGVTFSRKSDPAHKVHWDGKYMRMQYMHFGSWHFAAGQFAPNADEFDATDWDYVNDIPSR